MTRNDQQTERPQRSREVRAEGTRLVAGELQALQSTGWVVLHDVHWPGRQRARIDHVAVGPGGVVVVDSKNWSGDVTVRDGRLRQNGRSRSTASDAVAAALAAVTASVPAPHRSTTLGLLCLAGHDLPAEQLPDGVVVVGRSQLAAALGARPQVLTAADVAAVADALRAGLAGPVPPAELTTAALAVEAEPAAAPAPAPAAVRRDAVPAVPSPRGGHRGGAARRALRALLALVPVFVSVNRSTHRA